MARAVRPDDARPVISMESTALAASIGGRSRRIRVPKSCLPRSLITAPGRLETEASEMAPFDAALTPCGALANIQRRVIAGPAKGHTEQKELLQTLLAGRYASTDKLHNSVQ